MTGHRVWEGPGPGSGVAFVEAQRGLTDDQVTAIFFGEPLREPLPTVEVLSLASGRQGDVLGSSFSALVVSTALRELLERSAPGELQFVPTRLPDRRRADYAILNVLAKAPCMDLDRSHYERLPGHSDRFLNVSLLVLRPIPEDAPPIFHVAELPAAILVRDELRARIIAAGDAVGEFVPVEDYRWGLLP